MVYFSGVTTSSRPNMQVYYTSPPAIQVVSLYEQIKKESKTICEYCGSNVLFENGRCECCGAPYPKIKEVVQNKLVEVYAEKEEKPTPKAYKKNIYSVNGYDKEK